MDDPLRIDALVEVSATFIEVILGKSKEFINKVEVLLPGYFTTKHTKGTKMVSRKDRKDRGDDLCLLVCPKKDGQAKITSPLAN